jgi:hypothetical protein
MVRTGCAEGPPHAGTLVNHQHVATLICAHQCAHLITNPLLAFFVLLQVLKHRLNKIVDLQGRSARCYIDLF